MSHDNTMASEGNLSGPDDLRQSRCIELNLTASPFFLPFLSFPHLSRQHCVPFSIADVKHGDLSRELPRKTSGQILLTPGNSKRVAPALSPLAERLGWVTSDQASSSESGWEVSEFRFSPSMWRPEVPESVQNGCQEPREAQLSSIESN